MNHISDNWRLRREYSLLKQVLRHWKEMENWPETRLWGIAGLFRARLSGESLDDLLPEVYAAVCEAIRRIYSDPAQGLEFRLHDVQILGAIALHEGKIVEMKTGEGKTMTAALPLVLNALEGRGCVLVTTNSYLARRDADELRPLYEFLGLKEMAGVPPDGETFSYREKKEIYRADIVYSTHSALAFDYLQEHCLVRPADRYLPKTLHFCIVDEADAVLLDAANIPHIISGKPGQPSNMAVSADYIVSMMEEGEDGDYETDEIGEKVWLTPRGIRKAEQFFLVEDLYAPGNEEIVRHLILALRAHAVTKRDRQYIVRDGRVVLLDAKEGRLQERTKLRGGMHQAIESKEHVPLTAQSRATASITFQSYFNMYEKLAGMTGTGASDADEFRCIYGKEVVVIPPDRPVQRMDCAAQIYADARAQMDAAMAEILRIHRREQPVLVIVDSIALSREVDVRLQGEEIAHNVLNATNLAREAEIIREAARRGAVTVATSVAGRGTDIKPGIESPDKRRFEQLDRDAQELAKYTETRRKDWAKNWSKDEWLNETLGRLRREAAALEEDIDGLQKVDVRKLGGLAVLIIGMMPNRRQEWQARGRSGRKGDPGISRYYISLEDEIVRGYGSGRVLERPAKSRDGELKGLRLRRAVFGAQRKAEEAERERRRTIRDFEVSVTRQRELVYALRERILEQKTGSGAAVSEGAAAAGREAMPEGAEKQSGAGKHSAEGTTGVAADAVSGNNFFENREFYLQLADRVIGRYLEQLCGADRSAQGLSPEELLRFVNTNLDTAARELPSDGDCADREAAKAWLQGQAEGALDRKFAAMEQRQQGLRVKPGVTSPERILPRYLRCMLLHAVDSAWEAQVDYLQQLQQIVMGRQFAGRNVRYEFHMEARKAYERMSERMERDALRNVLLGDLAVGSLQPLYP